MQTPGYPDSYYRYTYVLNNPLKFTDPSGYSYQKFLAAEALNDYNPTGEAWNDTSGPSGASYGVSYGWFRSISWTIDPKTGEAFNTFTGERIDASNETYEDERSGNNHKVFVDPVNGQKFIYHLVPVEGKTWMITPYNKAVQFNWIPFYLTNNSSHNPAASNSGGLSWGDARTLYQFGGGTRVDVSLGSIDLSKVRMADFNKRGLATIRLDSKHFSSLNDALVHGTITLQLIPGSNQAKIALNSGRDFPGLAGQPAAMYDFGMESWGSAKSVGRNLDTFFGGLVNSIATYPGPMGPIPAYYKGTPFPIYYNGVVTIPY